MQTITLKVQDHLIDTVLDLVKSLPKDGVEIVQEKEIEHSIVEQDDELFGMFSHYVTHKLTDKEIEEAITQGALQRGMTGIHQ